ncbi:MAG: signal recognition particle-docking protein FtsY [Rhabdochlamydiaceae bacterium]
MFSFISSNFKKIKNALYKTSNGLKEKIKILFTQSIDEETFNQLEEILYQADISANVLDELVEKVRSYTKKNQQADVKSILALLKSEALALIEKTPPFKLLFPDNSKLPLVILVTGVNGSGKTTSIGKLAYYFKKQNKTVILGAADTFRAAAVEQLSLWSDKIGVQIVRSHPGSDPSSIVYDTISAAKGRGIDVVLLDTAGRLESKTDLMRELHKIQKSCQKALGIPPHYTLLVVDSTTGKNGLEQAKTFHEFCPLSALIVSKLDGSSKGGGILSIYKELNLPVAWIGVGESEEDLLPFVAKDFVEALFEDQ